MKGMFAKERTIELLSFNNSIIDALYCTLIIKKRIEHTHIYLHIYMDFPRSGTTSNNPFYISNRWQRNGVNHRRKGTSNDK